MIQPPRVGPITGAAIIPIPKVVMASVCSSTGNVSRRIACDNGIIAAPAAPWSMRNKTIWPMLCARPHSAEAVTNSTTEISR